MLDCALAEGYHLWMELPNSPVLGDAEFAASGVPDLHEVSTMCVSGDCLGGDDVGNVAPAELTRTNPEVERDQFVLPDMEIGEGTHGCRSPL